MLKSFREFKAFMRKLRRTIGRKNIRDAQVGAPPPLLSMSVLAWKLLYRCGILFVVANRLKAVWCAYCSVIILGWEIRWALLLYGFLDKQTGWGG